MFFLTGFYRQQLHRKRHVGNDVVVVVFCEGDDPFNPEVLTSNYNHVFILVRPVPDDPMGEGAKGEERKKGFSHAQKKKKKKKAENVQRIIESVTRLSEASSLFVRTFLRTGSFLLTKFDLGC